MGVASLYGEMLTRQRTEDTIKTLISQQECREKQWYGKRRERHIVRGVLARLKGIEPPASPLGDLWFV